MGVVYRIYIKVICTYIDSNQQIKMEYEDGKTAKDRGVVLTIFVLYDLIQEKKGGGRIPVLENKN